MPTQRRVKRNGSQGRQAIVQQYGARAWYELPDWAVIWLVDNASWITLVLAVLLAPAAILAIVLGAHSLPLEFLGVPAIGNDVGLTAAVFLADFLLLVVAVRPLRRNQKKGWMLVIAAAVVHLLHSLLLQHAISGVFQVLVAVYLYSQVRHRLT